MCPFHHEGGATADGLSVEPGHGASGGLFPDIAIQIRDAIRRGRE